MKTMRRFVMVGAVLAGTLLGTRAEACGLGFQLYLPFFSIGFGLGVPWTCAGSPCYSCASCLPPPPAPVNDAPVEMPPPARWIPSTPGAGHWLPEPNPYHYFGGPAAAPSSAPRVTVTK